MALWHMRGWTMATLFNKVRSVIGVNPTRVNKTGVLKAIRRLQQSGNPSQLPALYKLVRQELFDVYQDLENISDEAGLEHLSHLFCVYEGGKAVNKYAKFLQQILHEGSPSRDREKEVVNMYVLILRVVYRLGLWCTEVDLYQQTIESGLLDTLLTEVKWTLTKTDTNDRTLALVSHILHLLYNTAKIPWTRDIMKNRTLPVLIKLHSSDVILHSGDVKSRKAQTLVASIRFLNSVIAGYLLIPKVNGDEKQGAQSGQYIPEVIDLVFDCWRVVGERPADDKPSNARNMSLNISSGMTPEEELLRVSADILYQIPEFFVWIAQKDFVPMLTSDILERGSLAEREQCLRFILAVIRWESIQFVFSIPRLSRILLTLMTSSSNCLGDLAAALREKVISTIVQSIDTSTLTAHKKHVVFSDRQCQICDVLETLSNSIRQLATWGCSDIIAFIFGQLPAELKKTVVNMPKNGETILLCAMRKSHQETLELLLRDFGADVRQHVVYTHFPSLIQQYVPLLWWAAAEEKVDAIRAFLEHGAEVNGVASSGSTPLFAACARQRSIAIKYLLQHGGDPNIADSGGVTCLMKATQSPYLCELLLDAGAKVNAQDHRGRTALHVALGKNCHGAAEKLIESRADFIGVCDEDGSNALQFACMTRCVDTVNYMIGNHGDEIPPELQVRAYRLLTAYLLDKHENFDKARQCWKKGCKLRRKYGLRHLAYTERFGAFPSMQSACQLSDLVLLNSPQQEFAIFLKEITLGAGHKETLLAVFERGLFLLKTGALDHCLSYWTYVLQKQHAQHQNSPDGAMFQPFECIGCVVTIADVVFPACHGVAQYGSLGNVTFQKLTCILDTILEDSACVAKYAATRPMDEGGDEFINKYMLGVVKLANAALILHESEEEMETLSTCMRRIVSTKISNSRGQGILHMATDQILGKEGQPILCDAPTITLLLTCGSEVNDIDINQDTPLHKCVTSWLLARAGDVTDSISNAQEVASVLLEHGAHVDCRNAEGTRCDDVMRQMAADFQPIRYVSLVCLASRAIREYGLPYKDFLPRSLRMFVDLH